MAYPEDEYIKVLRRLGIVSLIVGTAIAGLVYLVLHSTPNPKESLNLEKQTQTPEVFYAVHKDTVDVSAPYFGYNSSYFSNLFL